MRILFDSKDPRCKTPFGTLCPGENCRMAIRIPASCLTRFVFLVIEKEDGAPHARVPFEKIGEEGDYEEFAGSFSLDETGLYFYSFRIETQNEAFSLFREGFDRTNMEEGEKWQISCVPASFSAPAEFAGKVFYQIFPDRYHQKGVCDTAGKLRPFTIHENKSDLPVFEPDENGEVLNCDFFGGNLAGIEEKLDELKAFGVDVIYLNPIFKAWSNHRYDTADYKKIDELLGTEEDFRSLCRAAHSRGMKIVIDGVFSHTGSRSRYFDEKDEYGGGALHNDNSPYRSWYDFRPDGTYTAWWDFKTLPCVNEMDGGYLDFIVRDEDSVVAHWLRAGADGFRLDVADELPDAFISILRRRLKELRPDALLIGEVWEDASNKTSYGVRRRYFTDGELDSVMNYPWRDAILGFVTGKTDVFAFRRALADLWENYPPAVRHTLMNLISTHDTPRTLSVLSPAAPPAEKRDRAVWHIPPEALPEALDRFYAAVFLQFTLPGMPCVYYGDEIGMQGLEDPFSRAYYQWDRVENNPVRAHYTALIALRTKYKALQTGDFSVGIPAPGVISITRTLGKERLTACVSLASDPAILPPDAEILYSRGAAIEPDRVTLFRYGFCLFLN